MNPQMNPQMNPNQNPQMNTKLEPGESIQTGFCPSCNSHVPVKVTGAGWHPGCLASLFHLLMLLVTGGGWGIVLLFFWIGGKLNKGDWNCMRCGQELHVD